MNIAIKLGKRLKIIRVAAGVKQKDLSKELNIPASLLSMYENGVREPSLSFLEIFSEHFKLPLSQLFVLMEETSRNNDDSESGIILEEMKNHILKLEKASLEANRNDR